MVGESAGPGLAGMGGLLETGGVPGAVLAGPGLAPGAGAAPLAAMSCSAALSSSNNLCTCSMNTPPNPLVPRLIRAGKLASAALAISALVSSSSSSSPSAAASSASSSGMCAILSSIFSSSSLPSILCTSSMNTPPNPLVPLLTLAGRWGFLASSITASGCCLGCGVIATTCVVPAFSASAIPSLANSASNLATLKIFFLFFKLGKPTIKKHKLKFV